MESSQRSVFVFISKIFLYKRGYPFAIFADYFFFPGKGDPYKIGAAVLMWQMQHAPYAEYYTEASKRKIPAVFISSSFPLLIIFAKPVG
jgi:hypothetical protein